jgi:hypothetical protein
MRPAGFQYPGYNYSSSSHSRSVNRNTRQNSPPTPPPSTSFPISSSFENIPMPPHDSSNSLFEQSGEFKSFEELPYLVPSASSTGSSIPCVGVHKTASGAFEAKFKRQDGSGNVERVGTFKSQEEAIAALEKRRAEMGMPQKYKLPPNESSSSSRSYVGVYPTKSGKWEAKFRNGPNKIIHVGTYDTQEAAAEALEKRKAEMGIPEKSKRG